MSSTDRQSTTPGDWLLRSQLAVPATSEHFFTKAARGAADSIFLDLEDAVAPQRRIEARANAVAGLNGTDWGHKQVSVRVNSLGTEWGLEDILAIARCPRLDAVLLPKVECAGDVIFLDRLLTMIERTLSRTQPLGIEVLIETTRGLADVDAIAAASGRLRAMIFGVGDYSIDLQNFETVFGAASPDYAVLAREAGSAPTRHWNDQWHFALAKIANACRANNIRPIDGPYTDYGDTEGYRAACRRSRALGFEGKWAIHPSQVALANEQFSPQPHQIAWARKIVEQMEAADSEGRGAIGMGGVLFDRAHVKLAQKILNRASQLDATVSRSS